MGHRSHHQKHNGHEPPPAVVMGEGEHEEASDLETSSGAGQGSSGGVSDAEMNEKSSRKSSEKSAKSGDSSSSAKTPDEVFEGAKSRWREVAGRAGHKLSELFDEGKVKVAQGMGALNNKVAGAADDGIDEAFDAIRARANEMMEKGKSARVRIKLKERELTEVPLAALAAAEAASLWWFGPLRMVLGHIVGRALIDLEIVSSADPHVSTGRGAMANGDVDDAIAAFDEAIKSDHTCASAHFYRGIALKMRGDKAGAKSSFQRAEECDARGETGAQAKKLSEKLA